MNKFFYLFFLIFFVFHCQTTDLVKDSDTLVEIADEDKLPPPVSGENIQNEKGEFVFNNMKEHEFFQAKSNDYKEFYRVIVSSEQYSVRQIRGTSKIQRKPDPEGDRLIQEEMGNYNIVNLNDEGILDVSLNSNTGTIEVIRFDGRVPRINEIAKMIQNDVMRWEFLHELVDDKAQITKFKVYYRIILQQKLTREEIKERFLKKKKKR
ncbi:MAG: hypothetical protein JJT78_17040 [Leptospira sp.]|nr:hypothetical protein [Leptospira sp.]